MNHMDEEYMLTTIDNPYDPFTQFESWLAYDEQKGYNTNGLLARLTLDSNELSNEENELAIAHAVENIFELFPGMYKKVTRTNK
jgi:hypothetical protein